MLRSRVFREVADDPSAGVQAGLVVVLVGILEGSVLAAVDEASAPDTAAILYSVVAALIGWLVWAAVVWAVGARLFERPIEFRPVVRAVAFTHAPSLLYGLAAIPPLTAWAGVLLLASLLWFAAALVACVEGIMDLRFPRALGVTAVALVAHEVLHQALRLVGAMG